MNAAFALPASGPGGDRFRMPIWCAAEEPVTFGHGFSCAVGVHGHHGHTQIFGDVLEGPYAGSVQAGVRGHSSWSPDG